MKLTQAQKILERLQKANGEWVNGRVFIQEMMISQAHARVFELERKGYIIEASDFKDEYGFKSYRLISEPLTSEQTENVRDFMAIWGPKPQQQPVNMLF